MSKAFGIVFSKRTFVQSMIQSNTLAQQKKSADRLVDFVHQRVGDGSASSIASGSVPRSLSQSTSDGNGTLPRDMVTRTRLVEVWELQRRVTLFHSTWQAPFLPHDGEKQWRWVDMAYQRHPWSVGDKAACSSRTFPVLELPAGWKPREGCKGFEVAAPPGPSDSEGWQYGADFYASSELWYSDPTWFHCRRRLWRMEVEVEGVGDMETVVAPNTQRASTRSRFFTAFALLLVLLVLLIIFGGAQTPASLWGASILSSPASCIEGQSDECRLPGHPTQLLHADSSFTG